MKKLSLLSTKAYFSTTILWILTVAFLLIAGAVQAQEEERSKPRPVRNTFESIYLIDNHTVMVPIQGTFQMDIQHRFGTIDKGYEDFWGLYAPSNIRIAFDYVPIDNLMIGFGFTKERKFWDFNAKYALFKQGRTGGWPVSVTYYVNAALDTRSKENFPDDTYEGIDRFSYFHQLMFARKFTRAFSLQASANVSHFNFQKLVPGEENPEDLRQMNNDHLSLSFLGRYKISATTSIIAGYDLPLTDHEVNNPEPNLSFGVEVVSSSHAFQIFLGNYKGIVPQFNNVFNQNTDFLIGFNMTRLWNF